MTLSLSQSIKLYMDDVGIDSLGHRRWILTPFITQTGFGISARRGFSATYVIEETPTNYDDYVRWQQQWPLNEPYILWPVKGEHPLIYFGPDVAWSVMLRPSIFEDNDDQNISVKLMRNSDGKIWNFSNSKSNGYFHIDRTPYGYCECISFCPDNITEYKNGESWSVEITGLKLKGTGRPMTISYATTFGLATPIAQGGEVDSLTGPETFSFSEDLVLSLSGIRHAENQKQMRDITGAYVNINDIEIFLNGSPVECATTFNSDNTATITIPLANFPLGDAFDVRVHAELSDYPGEALNALYYPSFYSLPPNSDDNIPIDEPPNGNGNNGSNNDVNHENDSGGGGCNSGFAILTVVFAVTLLKREHRALKNNHASN